MKDLKNLNAQFVATFKQNIQVVYQHNFPKFANKLLPLRLLFLGSGCHFGMSN